MWKEFFSSFLSIALELTALFVLVSFFINLLQGFIPYEKLERMMEESHPMTAALVTLAFAFATPFCSCSTIPIVVNLLNKNVRFAIVMIFLFASPVLDPTIITLMSATLGLKVAVIYTVLTSLIAVVIGFALERFGFEKYVKKVIMTGYQPAETKFNIKGALLDTFKLMKTVYPFLIIGAAIGALIHGVVPAEWISVYLGGEQWWLVPIAAIIGIPLYIRLSAMIPISQIMIVKGMALGPVMALMISSAGASLPELALLNSIFQKRLVIAFIGSVFTMATLSGLLFYLI